MTLEQQEQFVEATAISAARADIARTPWRVLIEGVFINSPGGAQLLCELSCAAAATRPADAEVVALLPPALEDECRSRGVHILSWPGVSRGLLSRWRWYDRELPRLVRRHRIDVVYSFTGIVSKNLCRACGVINTLNNMLPFTPERDGEHPLLSRARLRVFLQRQVWSNSMRRADAVVLHSRHALDLISRRAGEIASKTEVVLSGMPRTLQFDSSSPPAHPYGGQPYLFYLSAIYPHKNHLALIEAYRRAQAAGKALPPLFLAGLPADGSCLRAILDAIDRLRLADRVKYLGLLPRADLAAWLHHATANVFPSICETNSVVLAEVIGTHGVLACSRCPPMPEIVGDAGLFFDPYSPDSIAEVLGELCHREDLQQTLRSRAAARAKELTWEACGETIWRAAYRARAAFERRTRSGLKPARR